MTDHQAALVEKARSSIDAASFLVEKGFFDIAVSRAYYAMFYVAEAFLHGEGLEFSKHSAVVAAFGQRFAKTGRVPEAYHRYLISANQARTDSDYDVRAAFSMEAAHVQIERAREFLSFGEKYLS
ncbi:MAG: HEPN domain-containing protein [Candidatus Hydrogenedentes bacterium]|nr:HEPN domain-containing protein [Candidatus Hydrogenedentota bacterium]